MTGTLDSQRLQERIRGYKSLVAAVVQAQSVCSPGALARLDLQMVEDRFELIEMEASKLGVLPKLDDMTVEDFVGNQ